MIRKGITFDESTDPEFLRLGDIQPNEQIHTQAKFEDQCSTLGILVHDSSTLSLGHSANLKV
jgi:hypothetical protein